MKQTPLLTDKNNKCDTPIKCKINGYDDAFPLLFAGGLVYDKYLLQMPDAGLNAKVIVPESPYWNGSKLEKIGMITLETLINKLDLVVNQYIGGNQPFAVVAGSKPGWIASEFSKKHDNCKALILIATEPPELLKSPDDNKEAIDNQIKKEYYLQENDQRRPEEQNQPLRNLFEDPKHKNSKSKPVEFDEKRYKSGVRQELKEALEKKNIKLPDNIPNNRKALELYRLTNGPLFWENPKCDDRTVWEDAKIDPKFMAHFFNKIVPAHHQMTLPMDKHVLIINGLYDFTNPYFLWDDYRKAHPSFFNKMRHSFFIAEKGGHIAVAVQKQESNKNSFIVNQEVVEKLNEFIADVQRSLQPLQLRSRL